MNHALTTRITNKSAGMGEELASPASFAVTVRATAGRAERREWRDHSTAIAITNTTTAAISTITTAITTLITITTTTPFCRTLQKDVLQRAREVQTAPKELLLCFQSLELVRGAPSGATLAGLRMRIASESRE